VQAEAVIDLIDASTTQAARGAMRSLEGEFSAKIRGLTRALIELRALVEAGLDFSEEDIDFLQQGDARERLGSLRGALADVVEAARRGSLLREGLHIVIAGEPNVGKSSLLNRLTGEDLAIVTDIPGTTRDPIRQSIDLAGVPAHIVDTAGLRETSDPVERAGVERAWAAIERADVILLLRDASSPHQEANSLLQRLPPDVPRIRVMNKIDLVPREPAREDHATETVVWLSAKTGAGVDLLRETVLAQAGWRGDAETLFVARERHLEALSAARSHLANAAQQPAVELFAEELRLAQEALLSLTGAFTADDLLGEIFSRFCIGK
jgi:tRNA modification GTPase